MLHKREDFKPFLAAPKWICPDSLLNRCINNAANQARRRFRKCIRLIDQELKTSKLLPRQSNNDDMDPSTFAIDKPVPYRSKVPPLFPKAEKCPHFPALRPADGSDMELSLVSAGTVSQEEAWLQKPGKPMGSPPPQFWSIYPRTAYRLFSISNINGLVNGHFAFLTMISPDCPLPSL